MSDRAESMADAEKSQTVKSREEEELGAEQGKGGGSRSTRVRTVSEGYGITEEQEMTLLAGEDGEDLDVIECFVDDYDSDMEEEIRRKDVKKVEQQEQKATVELKASKVEVLQVVHIVRPPMEESGSATEEHDEPLAGFEEEVPAPEPVKEVDEEEEEDEDEDVIQIVVENGDDLLEEAPAGGEKVEELPKVSVHVSDGMENKRILSKPLVKQVVMDVSGEGDKEDEFTDQNGGVGSPKGDDDDDQEDTPIGTQEDSDAEQPLVIAYSVEANVGVMSGRHQEDPDVLQLKLDLHQNMGEMDYEPDDDDHRYSLKGEERLERRIQIKEEPMSPIKDRLERILLDVEDIPTIELSSDDDFVELPPQKPKKGKKKSKKKSKHRSKSECSVSDATPITVEESLPSIKSTTSSKSLYSNDSLIMDAELLKTGFRMELRKRKSATRLEENGTPPPTRKLRNTAGKSDDYRTSIGQSKSRASIISIEDDIPPEKPPKKKIPSQKSSFQPISTVDKRKINSLFAGCEKPEEVPASILDDGMPLLDKADEDLFGKAFKSRQPVRKHAAAAPPIHRQTMFIDALPRATVKSGHHNKSGNEQPSTSKSAQKPKMVPEDRQQTIHELEVDLAMSSSDEDTPLRQKLVSAKGIAGSPAPKRPGRKRGRAPKQHIEDYFCPSPGSKKDSTETPAIDGRKPQPQLKRRKKRSRISSYSTNSEDETTESISLAATVSTITANRSVIATHEEEADNNKPLPVEPKPPKTDNLSIVVSPLTKEEIAKRSKCITPKKVRALSKASQTELKGLSWRIELNQIDFHSEYFERLYQLIKNGRELRKLSHPSNNNNFEGVVIVGRDAVRPPTPPERSPQRPPAAAPNGRARSIVEQLLFERTDEVEYVTTARVEPSERERMERSIRTNFRIPKIAKQSSRSPQDVTSSTHHDNDQQLYREDESRQSSSGDYSNDRQVTPEPQRQIAVGSRSPLRVENVLNSNAVTINRPVVAAPAAAAELARPLPAIRRTIRNENVQPPVVASQQPQPVESRYPAYRAQPEQAPPQYQANVFQPQPQIPPQQQQLGAYMASGQEMDVKPNISAALTPQAAMLGPGMMNRSSIFDSFQFMCQLTMMQMMQQQLQFPTMNAGGQMFPGPSVVPTAAACNPTPAPVPPMPPVQMMPPPAGVQQDEVSDQITQIFGCIDHLKGRCIKNPCQYPHTLPTEATLRQMLQASAQDVVMTTYHFIVGQDNLFMRYFPVYSEVMGRRNMRHQLIDAVSHCEQSKRAFPYYRYIVEGLTISGTLNRSKAVQLVLEKHRKISFDQIHVLISLILDTGDDVPQFLPWLDQFSQVQDYQYEIPSINRLLKCCVRSARSTNAPLHGTVADVAKLTFRLVMSVATGKEPFVDTDTLIEYAELLMRSNLGLDHEKLMHKYGKNELASSATRH